MSKKALWVVGLVGGLGSGWVSLGCDSGAAKPGEDTVEDTAMVIDSGLPEVDSVEIRDEDTRAGDTLDGSDEGDVADGAEVAGDACSGVSCEVPPVRCNEDRSGVVVSSEAVCVADGGAFECRASEAMTACAFGTEFCIDERCMTHAEFCQPDPKRRWTYFTKLAGGNQSDPLPDGTIADRCCFDFDGDGEIDNRLGQIFWQNRALLGDVNEITVKQIASGLLSMLVEIRGLPDREEGDGSNAPLNAEHVEIMGAGGGIPTNGATGLGTTYVYNPPSWFPRTHLPRAFGTGKIVDGRLLAYDGQSVLRTGGTLPGLQVPIKHVRFDARVSIGPNGRGLAMGGLSGDRGGQYGGLVPTRGFYELVNAVVTEQCPCAQFGPNVLPVDLDTGECNPPIEGDCSAGEPYCQAFTGPLCSAFMGLFEPDIDSDGDGKLDSLSVGFWFEGTSIEVTGCTVPTH